MRLVRFLKRNIIIIEIVSLLIIAIPSFIHLLNKGYFSMHDDQHVVRLFLLDRGIHQGYLFPRWVDGLGFGFGYPLFNFYPPLVYYVAEAFHLVGFSFVWSIKLTFILGFILATIGMYLFAKRLLGRLGGLISATLYNYFFYHAVTAYVRGALAEFFSLSIIPFVFLTISNLSERLTLKNAVLFSIAFALLIINHSLIAFPFLLYLIFFFIYYFFWQKNKQKFVVLFIGGCVMALGISAFFWGPSYVERQYTMIDDILTKEMANYTIHYIYPEQFLFSQWGYGGSIVGPHDGLTFQLGRFHLVIFALSIVLFAVWISKKVREKNITRDYIFFLAMFIFSIFMTTQLSSIIWNNIRYLWYLQFPWRFLTFAGFFLSVTGGYMVFFLRKTFLSRTALYSIVAGICIFTIYKYGYYFKPQYIIQKNDAQLTTREEVSWRVSKTSFEFSPKGVKTKKTDLNTTTFDIHKESLPAKLFTILYGNANITERRNLFARKEFDVFAIDQTRFQLNTYNFPGWNTFVQNGEGKKTKLIINDSNDYKLITVTIPKGTYKLIFEFTDTPVRLLGNITSITTCFVMVGLLTLYTKKRKSDV